MNRHLKLLERMLEPDRIMNGVLLTLIFPSLACLAVAMPVHHRRGFGRELAPAGRTVWRLLGAGGLLAALSLVLTSRQWTVDLVAWTVMLAVAGLVLTFLLTYVPRVLPAVGLMVLSLAPALAWWG